MGYIFQNDFIHPPNQQKFDNNWKECVNDSVANILNRATPDPSANISPDVIKTLVAKCPRGKAGGMDNVVYEHLLPVSDILSPVLANLFTWMLRTGYVPDQMKRGCIITLHKGGKKCKDEPNNYRAITLTSVVLKLFEMALLARCKDDMLKDLSIQQCGFQEGLGCVMTSFIVRESVYFSREENSKLYICFLDGRQAFDRVWHNGLLFKLRHLIDDTSLVAFRELYRNMTSCVKNQ